MKICYLAPANSVHTMKWARHFVERGYKVSLISFDNPVWDIPGLEFIKIKRLLNSRLDFALNVNKTKDILRNIRPDILHAHYATDYGFLAAMTGFHPFIISVWGSDIYITPKRSPFHKWLVKFNLSRADEVCSTSHAMAEEIMKYMGKNRHINITPFGVDTASFMALNHVRGNKEIVIGTIKALSKGKGYGTDLLIDIFAQLSKDFDFLRLKIVGDGEQKSELVAKTRLLGVSDKVEFLGQILHERVMEFLSKIDIYCCLSRSESFGVAPLEASSCGIPVIASRVGGLPEVILDGNTGILVDVNKKDQIKDALKKLIMDPEARREMGNNGRIFVKKKYEWRNNAAIMEKIYQKYYDKKKSKILLMTPSLNYGGEELSTLNIARELMSRDHEVVYMSSGGPLEAQLTRYNIRFVKANIKGRSLFGILKGVAEIRRFLQKEKISIIHAQTPWPALMSKLACFTLWSKIPVIWHDRGMQRGNYKYVAKLANIFFDHVITNSDDEKELLQSNGLSPTKATRIHNGLNIDDHHAGSSGNLDLKEELGIDSDVILIGMVGRMVEEKGFKYLIEAASKLEKTNKIQKCCYVLVGEGPLRAELEALVLKLGLQNHFFFLGFREDISAILRNLNILVVPSEFEPFGNIVLEGMLAGTAVIASKVGGIKEIISDGIDGIFVETRDPDMIAQNIIKLIKNEELRRSISSQGKNKIVSYFNIQRVVDEIEDVYHKITKEVDA